LDQEQAEMQAQEGEEAVLVEPSFAFASVSSVASFLAFGIAFPLAFAVPFPVAFALPSSVVSSIASVMQEPGLVVPAQAQAQAQAQAEVEVEVEAAAQVAAPLILQEHGDRLHTLRVHDEVSVFLASKGGAVEEEKDLVESHMVGIHVGGVHMAEHRTAGSTP
jgi:hypothetical protein